MIQAAIFIVFPLCMALAACTDFLTMTIPNRVSAILLASFLVLAPLAGLDWTTIGVHLLAGLTVFAVSFALFSLNIMGGGDAKLLTASAVWFGFNMSLATFIVGFSLFGGVLVFVILALRSQTDLILAYRLPVPAVLLQTRKVPYALAIATGGFLAFPDSPLMRIALSQF